MTDHELLEAGISGPVRALFSFFQETGSHCFAPRVNNNEKLNTRCIARAAEFMPDIAREISPIAVRRLDEREASEFHSQKDS